MNIHRGMTKLKLIGCVILLGMTCYGCAQKEEALGPLDQLDQMEEKKQNQMEQGDDHEFSDEGNMGDKKADSQTDGDFTWEDYAWEMIPGDLTMENLLVTALSPVGQTMYIWGGGWNEEDTGAGIDARTLGLSPRWAEFAAVQTKEYDYYDYKYQIHDGLDCSGYIGWLVYNLFETEDGKEGYVMKSSEMAEDFAKRGWGTFTPAEQVTDWELGDVMSMKGHVWLCLGMCQDGSVLILHSSVTGVSVCGTNLPEGEESEAVRLAKDFMSTCYPEWYERYPNCGRSHDYLVKSGQFRWSDEILKDSWKLKAYSAADLLASLKKKLLAN
ncbi:MAG: hypothetical protein IJW63_02095 [Lachnospiraceae bacterium]|nr:hypothetical protein [Lachnospiraceae bacterium]